MFRGYPAHYDDNDEEQLVEEFDPTYVPTQQEIEYYAIDTLGMQLPEDNQLLYLAKQALMKPLPDNWGAFQRRDGSVIYRHKLTQ